HMRMIKGLLRAHGLAGEPGGLWRRVGIEGRIGNIARARPEAGADYFVRIGFAGDWISAVPSGSRLSRKAGDRKVETSPEEMNGAALPYKAGTELQKNVINRYQHLPETVNVFRIVRVVLGIALERNRIRNFDGHRPDFHRDSERVQGSHVF